MRHLLIFLMILLGLGGCTFEKIVRDEVKDEAKVEMKKEPSLPIIEERRVAPESAPVETQPTEEVLPESIPSDGRSGF